MRLHRFYIGDNSPLGHAIRIDDGELVHQWKNVFRMKEKSQVILFGKEGIEYTCTLLSIDRKVASFEVISSEKGRVAAREIILCAALIKKDNFELIVQKAVELGVTKIIPVISERSEKKLLNKSRMEKIIIEATEQCGRVDVPIIGTPLTFSDSVNAISKDTKIICFEPTGSPFDTKVFKGDSLALYIGPEGGWTEEEIEKLKENGVVMNIPTYILRAETAAIAAITLATILA
jgi:16S rRNA (uracil1498-N3)-methyltransferase